jgi:acyl dehydratase
MTDIYDELQSMIGSEEGPNESILEVNKAMIFHWCKAMDDRNPLYTDEEFAKKSKYGSIIAPPPMAQAFCMDKPWPEPDVKESQSGYQDALMNKLHKAGYTETVATTNAVEVVGPIRAGDRLSSKRRLATVSPEKQTRTGVGFFITNEQIYTNQNGEVVCIQPFTTLHFKPPQARKE